MKTHCLLHAQIPPSVFFVQKTCTQSCICCYPIFLKIIQICILSVCKECYKIRIDDFCVCVYFSVFMFWRICSEATYSCQVCILKWDIRKSKCPCDFLCVYFIFYVIYMYVCVCIVLYGMCVCVLCGFHGFPLKVVIVFLCFSLCMLSMPG